VTAPTCTRCIGPRCTRDDEPREAKIGLLCRRCYGQLERTVAELPARADLLHAMLGHGGTGSGGGRRPKPGSRPPLSVGRHDLHEHLHGLVGSWTALVAEERGLHGPDHVTVHTGSRWLLPQLDWCAGQLWIDDMLNELAEVSRQVDTLTGWRRGWHPLPAPCPACGGLRLGRWAGDDQVRCEECGSTWPEECYGWLVQVLACDTESSLSADEAAERAGVLPATFRQWVSRGHVRRLGTASGQARYSTADVDAMGQTERSA
jgi:hypothetical protein